MDQRLASLEHSARQPCLAMEADGSADEKTRKRTEGAAKAVQAMHGDNCSANRVDTDPMCSNSFDVKTEPPALPCRDDVVVENGAAAPKSCLSPLEMRTAAAAGGLLSAGKITTATWTTLRPTNALVLPDRKEKLRTSTSSALYNSSFGRNNLLAAPSCRRVNETKSGQNQIFDPGGSEGRLRVCRFLGMACVTLRGGHAFGATSG